jgi:hypothetical protein
MIVARISFVSTHDLKAQAGLDRKIQGRLRCLLMGRRCCSFAGYLRQFMRLQIQPFDDALPGVDNDSAIDANRDQVSGVLGSGDGSKGTTAEFTN